MTPEEESDLERRLEQLQPRVSDELANRMLELDRGAPSPRTNKRLSPALLLALPALGALLLLAVVIWNELGTAPPQGAEVTDAEPPDPARRGFAIDDQGRLLRISQRHTEAQGDNSAIAFEIY